MQLNEYLKIPGALSVRQLALAVGVKSDMQIRQWQHGYGSRKPGPIYCMAIERATNGLVTRRDLRPDDWQAIWPELADTTATDLVRRVTASMQQTPTVRV